MSQSGTSVPLPPQCPHTLPDHAGLLELRNARGEKAIISIYGAQLLSWKTAEGRELLYCSPLTASEMKPGAAIRGGVPVCFPQFSNRGSLPKHGFVRNIVWQHSELTSGTDKEIASACLHLQDSPATRQLWPHGFKVQLQVQLGTGWISIGLDVTNTGNDSFNFTAALHTYLATPDVANSEITGLARTKFIDSARGHSTVDEAQEQTEPMLRINDENDRVYLSPHNTLQLHQHGQAYLQLEQQGFRDSVVWNPGPAKATQLGDMPAEDWRHMLCIEAAQIALPVELQPGEHWHGQQRLIYQG